MTCLALSLLLLIGAVRWWPTGEETAAPVRYDTRAEATIQASEVQPTRQAALKPPPPPPPLPPVAVPDHVILERPALDFSTDFLTADAPPAEDGVPGPEGPPRDASAARAPDTAPKQLRLVEPAYPRAAQKSGVRARVVVEVLVRADGTVSEARVVERLRLGEGGPQAVSELGFGLEEAALEAARRTTFFPARAAGRPVESRTTITIRFGR